MGRRILILRTLGLLLTLVLLVALAGADLPSAIAALRDPQRVVDTRGADVLVLYLLQLALVALCAWCALCVVLLAATSLRPSSVRLGGVTRRLTPRCVRQLLGVALGVGALTLTACGTPSGSAATPPSTTPAYVASSDAFDWALAQPKAAVDQSPAEPSTTTGSGPTTADKSASGVDGPSGDTYVVSAGDCLWEIASTLLGPAATTAEVAYFVDDLYQANHEAIGDNPDVLPVGATLAIPDA